MKMTLIKVHRSPKLVAENDRLLDPVFFELSGEHRKSLIQRCFQRITHALEESRELFPLKGKMQLYGNRAQDWLSD